MATGQLVPLYGDNNTALAVGNNQLISGGGSGYLVGFWVVSTSSGTVAAYDVADTSTSNPIIAATAVAVGWNPLPVRFTRGMNLVLGGTIVATAVWSRL